MVFYPPDGYWRIRPLPFADMRWTAYGSSFLVGPVEVHVERMEQLKALGVDQFSIYLQHDDKDATLRAYGEKVLPAVAEAVRAKS